MRRATLAALALALALGCGAARLDPDDSGADGSVANDAAPGAEPCSVAHASVTPPLTGPYCVGLERQVWSDSGRNDPFVPGAHPREVSVTLHYPIARGSRGAPAPYGDLQTWGVLYGGALEPGAFSNAVLDVAIAEVPGGFPLLVYSPGFAKGLAETNTFMIQELVSHGYVVVAVDHPHVSLAVRDGAGEIVRFGDGLEALAMPDDPAVSEQSVYAFPVVVDDLRFVLDRLTELAQSDAAWRGRIDAARVGVFGHSYGGAAAAELLRTDERVKAAINYDGRYHAGVLEHGIGGPLLLMAVDGRITADPPPNDNYGYREATRTAEPGYYLEVEGAIHGMFQADLGVLMKRKLGENDPVWSGQVDADLNLELCNAYNRAFFGVYLKGAEARQFEGLAARYTGVRFDRAH